MKLIIGLGNPGKEYEHTRHNVGFQCVDRIRAAFGFPQFQLQKKFHSLVSEGNWHGEKILLVKPETFMNVSGKAVSALAHFYQIAPKDLWVIYDDVDLPLGNIRVRPNGSAGSHNGMKSIIASLGFQNFPRIRIGVESRGISAPTQQDIASFVLTPFIKKEKPKAEKAIGAAAEAFERALKHGIEKAMEKYN